MAITAPGVTLVMNDLFGNIKPHVDLIKRIGATDFSAKEPEYEIPAGGHVQVPVSKIQSAKRYDPVSNHYRSKADTELATLTAEHFLQPFDVSGENLNSGVSAPRIKQIFADRAADCIALAMQEETQTALDAVTASTAVTLPASPTVDDWMKLAGNVKWLNKQSSVLCLSGEAHGDLKAKLIKGSYIGGSDAEIATYISFRDVVCVPGLKSSAVIVPYSSVGFIARVPKYYARYLEAGAQLDPNTGLAIGIVIADDQDHNSLNIDADLWFGVKTIAAPADASKAGVIRVGTK